MYPIALQATSTCTMHPALIDLGLYFGGRLLARTGKVAENFCIFTPLLLLWNYLNVGQPTKVFFFLFSNGTMPSTTPPQHVPLNNLTQPPPTIAVTTSGSQPDISAVDDTSRSNSPQSQELQPNTPSAGSTNASPASTPGTPADSESPNLSPQPRPRSFNSNFAHSDTLVGSGEPLSRQPSIIRQQNDTQDEIVEELQQSWSRPLFAPWSSMWLANIIAICVCAIAIMTLVYSHRADVSQRWNNLAAFFQYCQQENVRIHVLNLHRMIACVIYFSQLSPNLAEQ